MTIVVSDRAMAISLPPGMYRQLVALPHRQYIGLIAKVRALLLRKQMYGDHPPLGTPALELALYKLGPTAFAQLRLELKGPRLKHGSEVRRLAKQRRREVRAKYMREYRRKQKQKESESPSSENSQA